jgi:hypothetical protein
MEEIDILINNIENRNYHRQIKIETSKFTHRLKYWFYDILADHTKLIMISIFGLFTLLVFGSLAICLMISDTVASIYVIIIPFGYVLLCSLILKLTDFARQLRDEVS